VGVEVVHAVDHLGGTFDLHAPERWGRVAARGSGFGLAESAQGGASGGASELAEIQERGAGRLPRAAKQRAGGAILVSDW
jgi:hypothetical protein